VGRGRVFFREVVWSEEIRVVVTVPFEVRAHGVGIVKLLVVLGLLCSFGARLECLCEFTRGQ
jgi:hypothetical protein